MKKIVIFSIIIFSYSQVLRAQDTAYHVFLRSMYAKFDIEHVSVDSLESLIRSGHVVILDTRSKEEFRVSHIQAARWTDFDSFKYAMVEDIPKTDRIIAYCSVGYRSSVIAVRLKAMGYRNVQNLFGGIFEWVNEGRAVFREEIETMDIHPYDNYWGMWLRKGNKIRTLPK